MKPSDLASKAEKDSAFLDWAARRFNPLRYQPGGIGNWSGHLPFAYDLIASLRPDVFVELGTHYGESYFGFCQAVEENLLPTRCYAVDTWRGDEQSGFYDDAVYEEVDAYNQAHYSFSCLLRMIFDEAAAQFTDASIDLLHIDGLHTYEAVRHDFFNWLPKVKPGGVILLHDVIGRSSDFGVWRLWEELAQRFPAFLFHHSSGLGVVRVPGPPIPDDPLLQWLFASSAAVQERLRRHYVLLAENLEYRRTQAGGREATKNQALVKVYAFGDLGYNERQSASALVSVGKWQRVTFELHDGGRGPIRIDPADTPAIIEIAGIQVRGADDGQVYFHMTPETGFDALQFSGEVKLLPGSRHLRCASYAFDPQIVLPVVPEVGPGRRLYVELWLVIETNLAALIPANDIATLTAERNSLEREVAVAKTQLSALEASYRDLTAERDRLCEDLLNVRQQQQADAGKLHAREADLQNLTVERDRLQHEVSELSGAFRSEELRNRDLLESWSWRITVPLRWMGRIVAHKR